MNSNSHWHAPGDGAKQNLREVVIPKEDAVFWLDARGFWRNAGGKFRKKKIIDHFHASISRDENGYFLYQQKGDIFEKVYFPYEDTALFVFDVIFNHADSDSKTALLLNTGRNIPLNPRQLSIKNDSLYLKEGDDVIKFSERALIKISNCIEEAADRLYINIDGERCLIPEN
jgi:hypothetical protein